MNRVLRRSVEYAFANRAASLPFVREHAQEMSEEVMYRHIDLYVNEYSVDLGAEGRRAVELLFERARGQRHHPAVLRPPLFLVLKMAWSCRTPSVRLAGPGCRM